MIIYQALGNDWVKDFQLTFRIGRGNTMSRINSTRTRFEIVMLTEGSGYYERSEIIYRG